MRAPPRVVLGMPAYNGSRHLPEAMDSILHQTFRDFALVVVDDASIDASPELLERYAARDSRIIAEVNPDRLGMVANWRRCFELGRRRFPEAEFFAWVSDHDTWHPRWLGQLVRQLDADPEAVLAYPRTLRFMNDTGKRHPWMREAAQFDTDGLTGLRRVRATHNGMFAGSMVYGLFRADDLERCGVFRPFLNPDRVLLLEASTRGVFRQVPETLYYRRRMVAKPTLERQRRTLFSRRPPLTGRLPPRLGQVVGLLTSGAAPGPLRFGAAAVLLPAVVRPSRAPRRIVKQVARPAVARIVRRHPAAIVTARTLAAIVRPRGGAPMLPGLTDASAKRPG